MDISKFHGHMPIGLKLFAIFPFAFMLMITWMLGSFLFRLFKNSERMVTKVLFGIITIVWYWVSYIYAGVY